MAYPYQSDRRALAEPSLNNLYSTEKRLGHPKESLTSVTWHTDRERSSCDGRMHVSPAADHRMPKSADSPTSTTSLRSKDQTSRRSVNGLTCYFWAEKKHCKYSSEECLYAHEFTGKQAQAPIQREEGKPAVAGRNALNPHPVYVDWKLEHSRSAELNPRSEVEQRVHHIKAKAIQHSPHGERQDYLRDLERIHLPPSSSAPESISSRHTNHSTLSVQPTMSRQRADFRPSLDQSVSHGAGAFHQPFRQELMNYSPTTPHGGAAFAHHQSTQQTSPGHHQAYCPQPIDHLVCENLKYEEMRMMRAKVRAIYQFASAIDLAIKTMEEGQQSNKSDIKRLMDFAKISLETDHLARSQGDDESQHREGGRIFDSENSCQGDTHVLAPAQKCKITGKHMLRYDTDYDLPYELTAIAETLSQTHKMVEHGVIRLKNAKQKLGFAFENIGEQEALPQGWIQHLSPK